MSPTLLKISFGFLIVGALFYFIEWLFPGIKSKPFWRSDSKTDLIYWFFTPLITKSITKVAVITLVVFTTILLGRRLSPETIKGYGPIINQPFSLILFEMLLIGDFVAYWGHRLFHQKKLWKFHAIHHSSPQLDWLSSVRLHPFNDVLMRSFQAIVILLIGFPLTALATYIPFLSLYALLLHANVSWDFGPLRTILASPRFHRWHHTSEEAGLDKNFAGFFPLWDILFGTYYMPKEQPLEFGVTQKDIPESFFAQMLYPFQKEKQDPIRTKILIP